MGDLSRSLMSGMLTKGFQFQKAEFPAIDFKARNSVKVYLRSLQTYSNPFSLLDLAPIPTNDTEKTGKEIQWLHYEV